MLRLENEPEQSREGKLVGKQSRFVWIGAMLVLLTTALIWLISEKTTPVQASAEESSLSSEVLSSSSEISSALETSAPEEKETESSAAPEIVEKRYTPLTFSSVHAVWFSYIDFQEQTMGADEDAFRERFAQALENCASIDVNTLYVQVRPFADAMYPSEIFPWSKYASGRQGVNPEYDPLGIILELAHEKGIAVHAWINPLRISQDVETYLSPDSVGLAYQAESEEFVREVNGGLYFNPAREEVVQLIAEGIDELCRNYDLDGVNFDDYFYPTTDESFDQAQYERYTKAGGQKTLDDWRRENIDHLVATSYETCQKYGVPFGISPSGNLDYCYFTLYANVARWMNEPGYADYIAPQIYWGFEHDSRPFQETVVDWRSICSEDFPLICGLAAYKIGTDDGNGEWQDSHDVISRQIAYCERTYLSGWALYRYGSLFQPSSVVSAAVQDELEAVRTYQNQDR